MLHLKSLQRADALHEEVSLQSFKGVSGTLLRFPNHLFPACLICQVLGTHILEELTTCNKKQQLYDNGSSMFLLYNEYVHQRRLL